MVRYHRFHQFRKGEQDEEAQTLVLVWGNNSGGGAASAVGGGFYKKTRPKLLSLLFLSLLSCSFILAPHLLGSSSNNLSLLYSFGGEDDSIAPSTDLYAPKCSSISNGSICCDRSGHRSDICVMKGDIRTHSSSSSIFLYTSTNTNTNGFINYVSSLVDDENNNKNDKLQHEKIKPYTRKWETLTMKSVGELNLIKKNENSSINHRCDVYHDVPAVFFSTSGYTGNLYHEFNDGIIPLYITSQHFNKKVVFVITEYHDWWIMKYGDIISQLSDYPVVDFADKLTHCFPEVIIGMRIHDELTVDSSFMRGNKSIGDFRKLLDRAYWPRINGLIHEDIASVKVHASSKKPKLVILSRNGSRAITNEDALAKLAEEIGFEVEVVKPTPTTELAKIYRALNSSDVMIGVHGAAMTHFLFMRPGRVFIQVVPLGTDWAAEAYYGEPAKKLGLKYVGYRIDPKESSLYEEYEKNDPILRDPNSVNDKGWEFTKKIYLDGQNVRLDLRRFKKRLISGYNFSIKKAKLQRNPMKISQDSVKSRSY